ncbi:hypothetical protein BU16DRAFT_74421 [Lophium mytilinum]|uniref:Uncharacterized protein n=1 Tax=Lophium mytilinum TaxID=390894 RepID=A0A6A6QM83_9PEZI|nr:hypothetical protein BU16DRAFT_74421 [Lophium mytilinum]
MGAGKATQKLIGLAANSLVSPSKSTGGNGKEDDSDQTGQDDCHERIKDARKRLRVCQAIIARFAALSKRENNKGCSWNSIEGKVLEEANAPVEGESWSGICAIAQETCPIAQMINFNLSIFLMILTGYGYCGMLTEEVMNSMRHGGKWLSSTWDCILATFPVPKETQVLRIDLKDGETGPKLRADLDGQVWFVCNDEKMNWWITLYYRQEAKIVEFVSTREIGRESLESVRRAAKDRIRRELGETVKLIEGSPIRMHVSEEQRASGPLAYATLYELLHNVEFYKHPDPNADVARYHALSSAVAKQQAAYAKPLAQNTPQRDKVRHEMAKEPYAAFNDSTPANLRKLGYSQDEINTHTASTSMFIKARRDNDPIEEKIKMREQYPLEYYIRKTEE